MNTNGFYSFYLQLVIVSSNVRGNISLIMLTHCAVTENIKEFCKAKKFKEIYEA